MAQDKENKKDSGDDELDLASLSALVRPSDSGAAPEKETDDGKIDLRALVASAPPPAPVAPEVVKPAPVAAPVEAKRDVSDAPGRTAKKGAAAAAKKDEKVATVVATPAPAPSGGGSGMGLGIGLGFGIALAAVGYFVMNGSSGTPVSTEASAPPASVAVADRAPEHADRLQEAPVAVEEADHESEPAAAPVAPAPTDDEIEDSADDEASAGDEEVEADDHEEAVAAESETRHSARSRSRRSTTAASTATVAPTTASTSTTAASAPPPATTTATTATARRGGGLDSVLDQALGTSRTPPPSTTTARSGSAARPAPSGDLPDQPSQADVRRVLASVMPQIRTCAGEQVGLAVATLMVRSDGTVASAAVAGSPFGGTPQGSCMEGALRGAHFPAFRQTTFRVQYPMSIRPAS